MERCQPAQAGPSGAEEGIKVGRKICVYYVYILQSRKNKKLYKGYTTNLKQRIVEHNAGKNTSTKSGIPWRPIYYQGFLNKSDARREEEFLKSGKGRERIAFLLQETLKEN